MLGATPRKLIVLRDLVQEMFMYCEHRGREGRNFWRSWWIHPKERPESRKIRPLSWLTNCLFQWQVRTENRRNTNTRIAALVRMTQAEKASESAAWKALCPASIANSTRNDGAESDSTTPGELERQFARRTQMLKMIPGLIATPPHWTSAVNENVPLSWNASWKA